MSSKRASTCPIHPTRFTTRLVASCILLCYLDLRTIHHTCGFPLLPPLGGGDLMRLPLAFCIESAVCEAVSARRTMGERTTDDGDWSKAPSFCGGAAANAPLLGATRATREGTHFDQRFSKPLAPPSIDKCSLKAGQAGRLGRAHKVLLTTVTASPPPPPLSGCPYSVSPRAAVPVPDFPPTLPRS